MPPFTAHVSVFPDETPSKAYIAVPAEQHFQAMPTHVEFLSVESPKLSVDLVRALPRRLITLHCMISKLKGLKQGDFPSTLRSLNISHFNETPSREQWALLPDLEELRAPTDPLPREVINYLPRTLKRLALRNVYGSLANQLEFPPHLTSFTIDESFEHASSTPKDKKKLKKSEKERKEKEEKRNKKVSKHSGSIPILSIFFSSLPQSLTSLRLPRAGHPISISDLLCLPKSLRKLSIGNIFKDPLFNDSNPLIMEKKKHLPNFNQVKQAGIAQGASRNVTGNAADADLQVTFIDFLPPDLSHLDLDGYIGPFNAASWSGLPKKLRSLTLRHVQPLPPGELLPLLPSTLTNAFIAVLSATEAQLSCIPKSLRNGLIFVSDTPVAPLSLKLALSIPTNINIEVKDAPFCDTRRIAKFTINTAATDGDYDRLKAALQGDVAP